LTAGQVLMLFTTGNLKAVYYRCESVDGYLVGVRVGGVRSVESGNARRLLGPAGTLREP
jgi:hypothetical protein